jgi:hypothetical protein
MAVDNITPHHTPIVCPQPIKGGGGTDPPPTSVRSETHGFRVQTRLTTICVAFKVMGNQRATCEARQIHKHVH